LGLALGTAPSAVGGYLGSRAKRRAAEQKAEEEESIKNALSEVRRQCESLFSDPALDPIREKVALFEASDQTFAMLTNQERARPEEKPAIALWFQKREQCNQNFNYTMQGKVPAQIVAVRDAANVASNSMIAELYLGRITYGELAEGRAKTLAEEKTAVANIEQALVAQNQQTQFQAQQLANQRIANWNAQMQTSALQQMKTQIAAPTMITTPGQPPTLIQPLQ